MLEAIVMTTRIYLIRHCEAIGNLKQTFQGWSDLGITPNGAKQLEKLGERFKDIHIDKVYSSPLVRARLTAKAVADSKGLEIITHPDLIEINGGIYEGCKFNEVFVGELLDVWTNTPHLFSAPEGESMMDVAQRGMKAVKEIVRENKGKSVAVASHGVVIRNLVRQFLYLPEDKLNTVEWSYNTAVNIIDVDEDFNFTIHALNDFSHLDDSLIKNGLKFK